MTEIDSTLVQRCIQIGTSAWSDALDLYGIKGVVRGLQRRCGDRRFAGAAVTAREVIGPLGTYSISDFAVGRMIETIGKGQVLMVDMGGADTSTFGGMAAMGAALRGAAAVVIDGGCRDVDDIAATGLFVASRHLTPMSGKYRVKLVSLNQPVLVGGVTVCPGDLVVGDATGVVVIPHADIDRVLAEAERMSGLDQQIENSLKSGESLVNATTKVGLA